ncbi:MAG: hypothetical protein P4L50_00385 [Anaerolineaceae bacterium]|nr:hypothetical protein [Anaerolineaceae bacterium]
MDILGTLDQYSFEKSNAQVSPLASSTAKMIGQTQQWTSYYQDSPDGKDVVTP